MNGIRHIFFDLDNTLWDHRENARLTLQEIFDREQVQRRYGIGFVEFHKEYFIINERLWAQIRDGEITKEQLRERRFYDTFLFFGIDNYELSQVFEHNFLDEIIRYNELVPGTLDLLEYLVAKNYRLHILSNGFAEVTARKCELSGISRYFETVTSADEINIRKPHPEIFRHALNKSGARISESVMIGDDWVADIVGAQGIGMEAIFFDRFDENLDSGVKTVKHLQEVKDFI